MLEEYDFVKGLRGLPQRSRAVLKAADELKLRYGRVAIADAGGWAFLMSRDLFMRIMREDRNVRKLTEVSDIAINPEGKVVKHRWRAPDAS